MSVSTKKIGFYIRFYNSKSFADQYVNFFEYCMKLGFDITNVIYFSDFKKDSSEYRDGFNMLLNNINNIELLVIKSSHIIHIDYNQYCNIEFLLNSSGVKVIKLDEVKSY